MNLEKARETALHIRKDPTHWYQGSWWHGENGAFSKTEMPASLLLDYSCGTTACVAGWRVALSFPKAVFKGSYMVRIDGRLRSIDRVAQLELELTDEQASWLFGGHRDEEQVLWALENEDGNWTPGDFYLGHPEETWTEL